MKYIMRIATLTFFLLLLLLLQQNKHIQASVSDSIVLGPTQVNATFDNLGVVWWISSGDTNHDSTFTLEFRKIGESTWHPGAPAMRAYPTISVDGAPLNLNYWAASAMFLEPGQTYELKLSLNDPDGGSGSKTLTSTTRTMLSIDPNGRQLYVVPGSGGGTGSQSNPFKGLQAAANAAQPGDVFHIANGTYQPFQLLASGTAGHPIIFHGDSPLQAVVDGGGTDRGVVTLGEYDRITAYVILENLLIRNGTWGIDAQNTQNILIRCNSILDVSNGIVNRRNNWEGNQTIADNVMIGRTPWPGSGIPEEEGIDLRGSGNVVAYNRVQYFGDCISVNPEAGPAYVNDVNGNDVSYCVDDGIEIDYNQSNTRAWRNRVMNSRMGVSVQPIKGGPAYIFRNEFFNLESEPIKIHNGPSGFLVVHNTSAMIGNGQSDADPPWHNAMFRNNLMLGTKYAFEFITSPNLPNEGFRNFDYDAWGTTRVPCTSTPFFKWNNVRYNCLGNLQNIGVETHGQIAGFGDLNNANLPANWDVAVGPGSRDLSLRPGKPEINAGEVLMNLNDPFVSDGHPDLGAFEAGQPMPWYGPRIDPSLDKKTFLPLVRK